MAALGAVVIGVTLWAWGQPPICTCGTVKLWVGLIWSEDNSQHIADWYTLSHVVHGMLIILVGRMFPERLSYNVRLGLAIVTGMGWEIFEHTDFVLGKFRALTIYQGYIGDSVLNSVMDYVWMWAGFFLAHALTTRGTLLVILAMEIVAGILGRDNLTFATVQLVYPLDWIEEYQQAINPTEYPDEVRRDP